jgi:hypothetical protein
MLDSFFPYLAKILLWMFFVGMAGCLLLVVPPTAYRLFGAWFSSDSSEQ